MRDRRQAGFTLVEILVAAGCAVLLLGTLVSSIHSMVSWGDRISQRVDAEADLDHLVDRWYADSATAWSIFTPANDVFGKSNADGHEFDLATEDALHRPSYEAYYYDASSQQLLEYTYGAPGGTPTATGEKSDNITTFTANTYEANELQDTTSPVYDPLFAPSTIVNSDVPLNLGSNALGGNRVTQIHIATALTNRTTILASATAPSSITVILPYTPAP